MPCGTLFSAFGKNSKRNFSASISFMDGRKTPLTVAVGFYVRGDAVYDFPRIIKHL